MARPACKHRSPRGRPSLRAGVRHASREEMRRPRPPPRARPVGTVAPAPERVMHRSLRERARAPAEAADLLQLPWMRCFSWVPRVYRTLAWVGRSSCGARTSQPARPVPPPYLLAFLPPGAAASGASAEHGHLASGPHKALARRSVSAATPVELVRDSGRKWWSRSHDNPIAGATTIPCLEYSLPARSLRSCSDGLCVRERGV